MATGGQPSVQISDITTCSICQETFKEPKALPCLHTFCLQCLDTYCADKDQQNVACPLCRKVYKVPPGGNINLSTSFITLQFLQVKQGTGVSDKEPIKRQDVSTHLRRLTSEEISAQMKYDVNKLAQSVLLKSEKLKQLEIDTSLFVQKISDTQNEISQKSDQVVALIQSHRDQMIEELEEFKAKILTEVEIEKVEIEKKFVIMGSVQRCCEKVMNSGTTLLPSHLAHDLHARVKELGKIHNEPDKLSGVEFTFKPSPSRTDDIEKFFGKLVLEDDTAENIPEFDFTKIFKTMKCCHVKPRSGEHITGITVLGGDLYINRNSSQVYVYNSDDSTLIRKLAITGSKQLTGLISCSHFNCLYLKDGELDTSNLYMYDVTNNVTTKWSASGVCSGLSITKCHNLLATLYDTSQIRQYTTDGSLIREISLDILIDRPRHCVQLSTGNYVVCHAGTQHGRVCIVDQSGRIIQSYDGFPGSGVGQLYYPRHLDVDTYDNILIVDTGNRKIQLLSSTLSNVRQVGIARHQLHSSIHHWRQLNPSNIHFDEGSNRLYLGEYQYMPQQTGGTLVLDVSGNDPYYNVIQA